MENLDDQTRRLLQEHQAYTAGPEDVRQLADAIWSAIAKKLNAEPADSPKSPAIAEPADSPKGPAIAEPAAEAPAPAPPDTSAMPTTPAFPARRRKPWLIAASITVLLGLAGALSWPAIRPHHSPQPPTGPAVAN
jgi:hypothetical protein